MGHELSFGDWLKHRRKMLDLTQKELARQVGCAVVTIRKIETDERRPSRELAEILARCLKIEPANLDAFITFARSDPTAHAPPPPDSPVSPLPIPAIEPPPTKLPRYQILEKIGQGGFAEVYRAHDTRLNRFVALKGLRSPLLRDSDRTKRFMREAQTIAQLSHPHIVPIYDVLEVDDQLYIVMRLIDGPTLEHLIANHGRLTWPQSLEIITAVAQAMDYAHGQDILHRDLKPANILLDTAHGPQLSDFGLAKLSNDAGISATASGNIVGTPHYIAPEIWEGEAATPQSDIYALGCIVYEMLTGQRLFQGESPPAIMMAHFMSLRANITWPDNMPAGLPATLAVALARTPSDRFASADEMLTTLSRLSAADASAAHDGGMPATTTPAPDSPVPGLLFLDSTVKTPQADRPVFVAREKQLAQLDAFLSTALAGEGRIVSVTGEAGRGKTSLLNEFAYRAQQRHPDLVVARGACDVYTGIGDPFLPFRDILQMLSGDIETQWTAGAITRDHALRLWQLMPQMVEALAKFGPNLIDTFVPGEALLNRVAMLSPDDPDQLTGLQALINRTVPSGPEPLPDPSRILEEYTSVLLALVSRQPLLLMLDDLHWADLSSISLLCHLGQRLAKQPILILVAYRPEELAQSQTGRQHPLENVLSEFRRQFGNCRIALDDESPASARAFVEALLDTEPNRLGQNFRDELTRHSAGHPLFTTELLHDLQERGDLRRDDQGCWIEGSALHWGAVPARVEGVVEKRLRRLSPHLHEILAVASVEGENFTAEVVADVLGLNPRKLVRQLSGELNRQHRLVEAQGVRRLERSEQRLSLYRFRHNLYQKYLYLSLDDVERAYQHEAVGETLEQLYGEQHEDVAGQLARHFEAAGQLSKAVNYLEEAGDAAARVYANTEAETHYKRALELAGPAVTGAQLTRLYVKRGRRLQLDAQNSLSLRNYAEMHQLAQTRGDQTMELAALMEQATLLTTVNPARDPVQGQAVLEQARQLATELGDRPTEARIYWNLLLSSAYTGGNINQRLEYGRQALALARSLDLPKQLAYILNDIFYAYAGSGQWLRARELLAEASPIWQELGNLPMLAETLMRTHWAWLVEGDYQKAVAFSKRARELGQESNNLDAQALSNFLIGFVYLEWGRPDRALTVMEASVALAEQVANLTPLTGTRADLGWVYATLGDVERGLQLAHLAWDTAKKKLPILRFWPHAILVLLRLQQGDVAAAASLADTLADYREVRDRFGYMPFMWVRVALAHAELALAQNRPNETIALLDDLLAALNAAGLRYLLPDALLLKARALRPTNPAAAADILRQALAAAEALESRRTLWPILAALSEIEQQHGDPAEAESLRKRAEEIVAAIANRIEPAELRAAFLQQQAVNRMC